MSPRLSQECVRHYLDKIKSHVNKHGIKYELRDVSYMYAGERPIKANRCQGYFNEESLVIASRHTSRNILAVAYHEYSHFIQWIKKHPSYIHLRHFGQNDSFGLIWDWIEGIRQPSREHLVLAMADIQDCEMHACRQSWQLMRRDGADKHFNPDHIRMNDNYYVYYYRILLDYKVPMARFPKGVRSQKKRLEILDWCGVPSSCHVKSYYDIPRKTYKRLLQQFYPPLVSKI